MIKSNEKSVGKPSNEFIDKAFEKSAMADCAQRELLKYVIKKVEGASNLEAIGVRLCYRADGRIEYICPHGVGHTIWAPAKYKKQLGKYWDMHGCDGCCSSEDSPLKHLTLPK